MNTVEYKSFHEGQMMFNNGTTKEECALLLCGIPFSVFFTLTVTTVASRRYLALYEFVFIILPVILNITVLSEINHILLIGSVLSNLTIIFATSDLTNLKSILLRNVGDTRSIVTNYRASTNFVSAICILAVDFKIFPRRFAKTESYGFGLMDLGVGFFVCSHGLVDKCWKQQNNFKKVLKSSVLFLILGLMRVTIIKAVGYQEHITDITLVIGVTHELLLEIGLKDWVMSEIPRDNLIVANREGLVSCLGYVCIYFAAKTIASFLQQLNKITHAKLLIVLIGMSLVSLMSSLVAFNTIGISRRLANLGYILWVVTLSLIVIVLFLILKVILMSNEKKNASKVPTLFESINTNGHFSSFLLIVTYMGILCSVTHYLHINNIHLKLL
ncbi:hypothetical protein RUM43_008441 [Polyplax serrata]|uniref:Phosphatidylinositol-glycan biosynthesis class W protein n=1 Tax=Polyplax serrata TaxID=468196 RepID=A0AAN8P5P3_POLSC